MGAKKMTQPERREQHTVLRQIESSLETPMFVLSLAWIALLVVDLVSGLGPVLEAAMTSIWIIFVGELLLKFVISPNKILFIRRSWLNILALVLPALRVFRLARVIKVLRFGRAVRGLTLARLVTAFNRGLHQLRIGMSQFAFGYVLMLTVTVTVLGAAGVYTFERQANNNLSFGDALWFSAMMITTSGSDYWPTTFEGRILCFLLALYAFAVFGYVTATLATVLVGQQDASRRNSPESRAIAELRSEIAELNVLLTATLAAKR